MSETLESSGVQGRPTFLTVLCILTFIGSGLGLLGSVLGLIGSTALSMFAPTGSMLGSVMGLIAAALCLFGAVKMWGLYKQGFMIYVAGWAVSIIGGLIAIFTFKTSDLTDAMNEANAAAGGEYSDQMAQLSDSTTALADSMVKSAMWTGWIISLVIAAVFILMYNANKKHLVR